MMAISVAFLLAAILSLLLTPWSIRQALKWHIVARPSPRKIHPQPIPCWGGIAIILGVLFGTSIGWLFLRPFPLSPETIGIAFGLLLLVFVGTLDDRYNLPAKVKLFGQILAALFPLAFGVRIAFIKNPFGDGYLFFADWQSWLLTLLWIVGLTNA
ncbi:MAG: hypothetical protein KEFWMYNX_002334, partial [Candidatus Fervidibacter sp.]